MTLLLFIQKVPVPLDTPRSLPLATDPIQCQLLTLEAVDIRGRLVLRYYGLLQANEKDGGEPAEIWIEGERATFFVRTGQDLPPGVTPSERRTLPLRSLRGEPVDALYFDSMAAFRRAVTACNDAGVPTFETDIAPAERYLMERFIHGQAVVRGEPGPPSALRTFRRAHLKACRFHPHLTMLSLDIETGVSEQKLYSIALHTTGPRGEDERVLLNDPMPPQVPDAPDAPRIVRFPDEKTLLEGFLAELERLDPDLLVGWHVIGFDLDYLQRACDRNSLPFQLGRGARNARIYRNTMGQHFAEVPGRVVLDGPALLRGAFYQFEDYRLETVAQVLLQRGKLIHSNDDDKVAEIERLYREDKVSLARYNLEDSRLVTAIFEKTGLVEMQLKRSQISGLLLDRIGRSNAAFDYLFLPRLHRRGYVAPNARDIRPQGHSAGGFVMEPAMGLYRDVVVLDFKSLYPSIIRTFRIDPLSRLYAAEHPDSQIVRTPAGYKLSATEHILPEIIEGLLEQRAQAKATGDSHLSQAIKILMNSLYGVMGSFACRFYHPELPSAITSTGQWLLKGCREVLEREGYTVLYGDTDSVFVHLKPGEGTRADTVGQRLVQHLNQYWNERIPREFGVTSYLEIQYEKHYERFILPPARGREEGAKKRYAGLRRVKGAEQLDFVGMEYVRSDWTPLAREFQYQLYWRIFHDEEVAGWMRGLIAAVRAGQKDVQLIYHKRLRKDERDYTKNVPPQVRAARMLPRMARDVRYVMTPAGPVPIQLNPRILDYDHYIEKQLRPIADAVLPLVGLTFEECTGTGQMRLGF